MGAFTWSKMREIMDSVRDNKRTAVRAAHGLSKTFSSALIAVWFYNCFPKSKVITTAPIFPQVDKLLWAEIRTFYQKVPGLLGECLKTEVRDTGNSNHYMLGFSTDDPSRAEGFHAPEILYIFDEAKGIPQWMWESAKGGMNAGYARWLAISTTDGVNVGEQYYNCFKNTEMWNCIHMSAYDSPDVTGELFQRHYIDEKGEVQLEEKSYEELGVQISGKNYIEDGKKDWGESSVLYRTKVLGEIVDEGADTIIQYKDIYKMWNNTIGAEKIIDEPIEVGVDSGRFGGDSVVMWKRKGMKVLEKVKYGKADLMTTAKRVMEFVDYDKTVLIKNDDTGVGGGITDRLIEEEYNVVPVNFGALPKDNTKYDSTISEMWFEVGEIIKDIECEYDKELEKQLVNRQWDMDKKGRRVVESKKEYKKRTGQHSPDDADGFLLAFYNPNNTNFNLRII